MPLVAAAYKTRAGALPVGKLGTVFGGAPEVGLKVEDLLKREAKL